MESMDIIEKLEVSETLYNQLIKRARRQWEAKNNWYAIAEREQDPMSRDVDELVGVAHRQAFWTIVEILQDAGYSFTQIMKDAGIV